MLGNANSDSSDGISAIINDLGTAINLSNQTDIPINGQNIYATDDPTELGGSPPYGEVTSGLIIFFDVKQSDDTYISYFFPSDNDVNDEGVLEYYPDSYTFLGATFNRTSKNSNGGQVNFADGDGSGETEAIQYRSATRPSVVSTVDRQHITDFSSVQDITEDQATELEDTHSGVSIYSLLPHPTNNKLTRPGKKGQVAIRLDVTPPYAAIKESDDGRWLTLAGISPEKMEMIHEQTTNVNTAVSGNDDDWHDFAVPAAALAKINALTDIDEVHIQVSLGTIVGTQNNIDNTQSRDTFKFTMDEIRNWYGSAQSNFINAGDTGGVAVSKAFRRIDQSSGLNLISLGFFKDSDGNITGISGATLSNRGNEEYIGPYRIVTVTKSKLVE